MLFKMLRIEREWVTQTKDVAKPRQLFVTQSRVLADKVEDYFLKLVESLATAPRSLQELVNLRKKQRVQREEALVDLDDDVNGRNDFPERFSLLEDRHFPLFLTFDKVIHSLRIILLWFSRENSFL